MEQRFHPNIDEYELIYGALPETRGELVSSIEELLHLNPEKVREVEEQIASIEWLERDFVFYIVPKGTPRPRTDGNHFYVKGAKQLHRIFEKYLADEKIICTRVEYALETYQPTPTSGMSKMEILMAEKGLIRPLVTPDWDNLAKTYTDCLQDVILLNDNIICDGRVSKFYSLRPRIHIGIRWMKDFDSKYNEKKTRSMISYMKYDTSGGLCR